MPKQTNIIGGQCPEGFSEAQWRKAINDLDRANRKSGLVTNDSTIDIGKGDNRLSVRIAWTRSGDETCCRIMSVTKNPEAAKSAPAELTDAPTAGE